MKKQMWARLFRFSSHAIAMHRAGSRQRAAIRSTMIQQLIICASTTPPRRGNTLLLRMMVYSTWKIEHVLSKGVHATEGFGDGFRLIYFESQVLHFSLCPLTSAESTLELSLSHRHI